MSLLLKLNGDQIHSVDSCTKEFQYINNVIEELGFSQLLNHSTEIYYDNTGNIPLTKESHETIITLYSMYVSRLILYH